MTTAIGSASVVVKGKASSSVGFNGRPSLGARKCTGDESESVEALAVGRGSRFDQV